MEPLLDLVKTLYQPSHESNFQLFYDGARYVGFDHDSACRRAAPAALQNLVIHLADDLADGDCDYMAHEQAITAVYTLHQLIAGMLSALDPQSRSEVHILLAQVGIAQHQELSTHQWTSELSRQAARGLNGDQFRAYFCMLAAGTSFRDELMTLGHDYGVLNHFANDIHTGDKRFYMLPNAEQEVLKSMCLNLSESMMQSPHDFIFPYVRSLLAQFK